MKRLRSVTLIAAYTVLVFLMGLIMGEGQFKTKINDALTARDTMSAVKIWYEMQRAGIDVTKEPLYFISIAMSFAKRGNTEGVNFNLMKAVELLRK